jgi:hypothetical protein
MGAALALLNHASRRWPQPCVLPPARIIFAVRLRLYAREHR